MKKLNFKYLILSALLLSVHVVVNGQSVFKVDNSASKMVISGTSSVHDWDIEVADFECTARVTNSESLSVSDVNVTCEVEKIKSHNRIMDNKTHKALEGDDHPEITFRSTSDASINENGSNASVKGELTIAGKTKTVSLPFTVQAENQAQVKVSGKLPIKMSDYGIDPPTAMMGALKTGDEVEIIYDIVLKKQ